ncbi:MAG TPA: ABC transporter ATP-binding protein [Euryarchaeota archaeon]|nr:ABC transporter ATP-binding protein [Euryarchaeota archaeon]
MTDAIIQTQKLTRHFDNGKVKAVRSISFEVNGGIHGFLGPNGAGKSTTIKMLVGAISRTAGDAKVFGYRAGSVAANAQLGYLPEHPHFYEGMTLRDYLIFMGRLGGMPRSEASKKAMELAEWLDLIDAFDRNISDFSAGMKQKAGFAQALIHEPNLVIFDEPTANLDAIGRAHILDNVKKLSGELGITVFISSHVLSEIDKVADAVTIINKGKIVLDDDIKTLKEIFSGNRYIIRAPRIDLLLDELKKRKLIGQIWNEEPGQIEITPSDEGLLRKEIPRIFTELDMWLDEFKRREISLEDVFMIAVSQEDDSDE